MTGEASSASQIHPVGLEELEPAAQVLAAAFRDNPLNRAVIGPSARRRLRSNLYGSRAAVEVAAESGLLWGASRAQSLHAVLLAVAPDAQPLPLPAAWTQLRVLLGQGWRTARRWSGVHFELERVRPREPHWYLDLLGVEPGSQRRGVGGALLRAWLARVDADGAPSYLETDRRANLDFYARAGYEVVGTESILGTDVWRMWRPRRAARTGD
jgi:GNAT superfamily N-acetyltransferase